MQFDCIIVGGGLVGASLALALTQHSAWRVALIDAKLPSSNDPRLFALNQSSCHFLKNLGIWSALAVDANPIHQVHVSYQRHLGSVRLKREDCDLSELGFVIPARVIEQALHQVVMQHETLTFFNPATLENIHQTDDLNRLTLNSEGKMIELETPLLIGADGVNSKVRELLNFATETVDYHQSAVVTRTQIKRSHQHIAYERFIADGAIAMLPLSENECATIWTTSPSNAQELMTLTESAFLGKLQRYFGYRLGRLLATAERFIFPLKMVKVVDPIKKNVYLLGNAAHTLSPIAAQGFNLALFEVASLVEQLAELAPNQMTAECLQAIQTDVSQQQKFSIDLSHRLSVLFSRQNPLKSMLLPLGMMGFDSIQPLKQRFIKQILGQAGSMPTLLTGTNAL